MAIYTHSSGRLKVGLNSFRPVIGKLTVYLSLVITIHFVGAQPVRADEDNVTSNGIVVSAGDTTQRSTVLWARATASGKLSFEICGPGVDDCRTFHRYVADPLVPAKVKVFRLKPATEYRYYVTDASGATKKGEFRTPAPVGQYHGLTIGTTGDWQQAPPYLSLDLAAGADLDLFILLGDTIYADTRTPALDKDQARTLNDFRIKHDEKISGRFNKNFIDPLYASTTFLATIDDHEIVDNFAGGALPGESPDAPDVNENEAPLFTDPVPFVNETQAYQDAMQAFVEYHPINYQRWWTPFDDRMNRKLKLYRYRTYGSDAAVFILDTRSFRDAQIEPVEDPTNEASVLEFISRTFEPGRTLLGAAQMRRLKFDLLRAKKKGIVWKFIVIPEPIQNFGVVNAEDRFEGYALERTRLLSFIRLNRIRNVVFLSADLHGTIVNNLAYQVLLPVGPGGTPVPVSFPVDAFEIVNGPAAFFTGRFGPAVVNIAAQAGLITSEQKAFYDTLPIAPDPDEEDVPDNGDNIPDDKDDFVKALVDAQVTPLGYDPVGLDNNLPDAVGLINAELIAGDYLAAHNFSWTELHIEPDTHELIVTVYGVDAYSQDVNPADPEEPFVICHFVVQANMN